MAGGGGYWLGKRNSSAGTEPNAAQYGRKILYWYDPLGPAEHYDNPNSLSIRGSSLSSPYQGSYGAYLAAAINQELEFAKKLSQDSGVEITGAVLKNNIDASGFSTGTIDIQARFIVKRNGQARYNNVMMVHHEFPSSFAGAVAIPRAVQEYPVAVQRLLASLYADKAFINALK